MKPQHHSIELISPRKRDDHAIMLFIGVDSSEDECNWKTHTASVTVKSEESSLLSWGKLNKRRSQYSTDTRGDVIESFVFKKFSLTDTIVRISFKVWLSGGFSGIKWFKETIETEELEFIRGKIDPRKLDDSFKVYEKSVLHDRAVLSVEYCAWSVYDIDIDRRVGILKIKTIGLRLLKQGLLCDILHYRGHKVLLVVDGICVGRANEIKDGVLLIEDELGKIYDKDFLSMMGAATYRSYSWKPGEDVAMQRMLGAHRKTISDEEDARRLSERLNKSYGYSLRASKTNKINVRSSYIPDSAEYKNNLYVLPICITPSNIAVTLYFANLGYIPMRVVPLVIIWEDFVSGVADKVYFEGIKSSKVPRKKSQEWLKRMDMNESHELKYMFKFKKRLEVYEGELKLTPTTGINVNVSYVLIRERETERVEIIQIKLTAEDFENTLSFKNYKI